MKKILAVVLCVLLVLGCFSGCGKKDDADLHIVTTIFPMYDWVREIVGENPGKVKITMLMDNGVDLHSYQPTADDIITISSCDMFIYAGGESDSWAEDVLKQAKNDKMIVIDLLERLGDKALCPEHDHHEEDDHHHHEYDEHVWLSLKNAGAFCQVIRDGLVQLDAENKAVYEANAEKYVGILSALDKQYEAVAASAKKGTVLFGDRFPFLYLFADYDLSYHAAFSGCSAESEASFETITKLAGVADTYALQYIMIIDGSKNSIATAIINATKNKNQQVLSMDSLQSVTAQEVKAGQTYLSTMEENLAVLEKALG